MVIDPRPLGFFWDLQCLTCNNELKQTLKWYIPFSICESNSKYRLFVTSFNYLWRPSWIFGVKIYKIENSVDYLNSEMKNIQNEVLHDHHILKNEIFGNLSNIDGGHFEKWL